MAAILEKAGVADQLFKAVHIWSGRLRVGLAIGTIISCTLMAAMVGIVGAEHARRFGNRSSGIDLCRRLLKI